MSSAGKAVVGLLGLALVVLAVFLLSGPYSRNSDDTTAGEAETRAPAEAGEGSIPGPRPSKANPESLIGGTSTEPPRSKEFLELKQQWQKLGAELGGHTVKGPHRALADETVDLLFIGNEMIALVGFLEKSKLPAPAGLLKRKVAELFHSTDAERARTALAGVVNESGKKDLFLRNWVYEAGRGCADDEFEAFRASIDDRDIARNAVFGHAMALVATDPQAATSLVVENLGPAAKGAILEMMFENLPDETDFREIERLLPTDQPGADAEVIRSGRMELFRRWAEVDFVSAADYMMENPKRIDPSAMRAIAAVFAERDAAEAVEWVQDLPPGRHFDHAIEGMMPLVGRDYPREAGELASLVGDQEIRKASFESLRSIARGEDTDGGASSRSEDR